MRSPRWFRIFLLSSFILSAVPTTVGAADLVFSANTTLSMSGVAFTTITVASGSEATTLTVDAATLTVTVPSGSTFTLRASSDITFTNNGGVTTTCGATSSLAIPGPKTNVLVTPTNSPCPRSGTSALLTLPPPAPTNSKGMTTGRDVTLTWVDPVASNFSSILILRNAGGTAPIAGDPYASVGKGVQTYADSRVTIGETYQYLIRSRDANGNSELNNAVVTVTVPKEVQKEPAKEPEKKEEIKKEEEKKTEAIAEVQEEKIVSEKSQQEIIHDTAALFSTDSAAIARAVGKEPEPAREQEIREEKKIVAVMHGATAEQEAVAVGFISYGTPTTEKLGEGERAGVLNSYKAAYGALPVTEKDWNDALRIASGKLPSVVSRTAEERAVALFKKIYTRDPVINYGEGSPSLLTAHDSPDRAALLMAAYGIRPAVRDLHTEREAISSFVTAFAKIPVSAQDWDAVRMIAYGSAPP